MHALSTRTLLRLTAFLAVLLTTVLIVRAGHIGTEIAYVDERVRYALQPSAARAYEYGERHFDSASGAYDIDRAEYFFREALAEDASYQLAHHQIARILFLRGDFLAALEEIEQEIELHGERNSNAYYVRGLIRGFIGAYKSASLDFAHFLTLHPESWAAHNDLAWVLMKDGDYDAALRTLEMGLAQHPENAWLLNSYAIALYEVGETERAAAVALRARDAVLLLVPADWSAANPGNDPNVAAEGLETFRTAALENLTAIRGE